MLNVSLINSSLLVNVNGSSEPVSYSACHTDTTVKDLNIRLVESSDSCNYVMMSLEFTHRQRSSTVNTRIATCKLFTLPHPPITSMFSDDRT
jgi:hypothetical protein